MKISIIVPVYNVEKYLERCLDSLINQTYTGDYEIICIDDCSTDGSMQILERYQKDYPTKIKVLQNSINSGLGSTRDYGISQSQGDYLMFVDSDDYVKPDYVETYANAMEANPCDIVFGGFIKANDKIEKLNYIPHSDWSIVGYSTACAKLWNKKFLTSNNLCFSSIRFAEDTYLSLGVFYLDAYVEYIDYAGYYYWDNPASITKGKNYNNNQEQLLARLYSDFMNQFDITKLSINKQHMIEYFYISDMLNTLLIYNRGCGVSRMKEKYNFFINDLKNKFPNYKNNPYFGFFRPKGQRLKTRIGVGGFALAGKLGLARCLFYLAAIMK